MWKSSEREREVTPKDKSLLLEKQAIETKQQKAKQSKKKNNNKKQIKTHNKTIEKSFKRYRESTC